jgi:diguanylate cyclase (GGDEF)-like protein/PAS domain S-box-containing protein
MVRGLRSWLRSRLLDRTRLGKVQSKEFSQFALIAGDTSNVVSILDREGRLVWANDAFTRVTGYSFEEAKDKRPGSFLRCTQTNSEAGAAIDAAIRHGYGIRRELVNRAKSGCTYWVDVEIHPFAGEDGETAGYVEVEIDISEAKSLQKALTNWNTDLEMMSKLSGVGAWRMDVPGQTLWWSNQVYKIHEVPEEFIPTLANACQFYIGEAKEKIAGLIESTISSGESWDVELPFLTAAGREIWVRTVGRPLLEAGVIKGIVGAFQDISATANARETLKRTQERLELATIGARLGLWDWHSKDEQTWVNPEWWESLGYEPGRLGSTISADEEPVHPDDFDFVTAAWIAFIAGATEEFCCEYRIMDGMGEWRWIQSIGRATQRNRLGAIERVSGVFTDIDQRKRADEQRARDQERLWLLANLDNLTNLPNRGMFFSKLEEKIRRCEETGGGIAVGIVDLDRFKEVNDSFGHAVGDELLIRIAQRLKDAIEPGDMVARLSGDEFVFLLGDIDSEAKTEDRIGRLLAAVCEPVRLSNHVKRGGGSIGWAVYPEDAATTPELLRRADIGLYAAKAQGRRFSKRFIPAMEAEVDAGRAVCREFETAIENDEIVTFYQPVITADGLRLSGLEALARWKHPEKGILPPAKFLSALKEPEVARRLGSSVRAMVLAQIKTWRIQGIAFGRIAINAVAADFEGDLTNQLLDAIAAGTLLPHELCIEVTEGVLLDGAGNIRIRDDLLALRQAGIEIAFDDFGTGYASLSHLREYPIDRLKIDCSFVMSLPQSPRDLEIVRTIGTLSTALGLRLTAEGVETPEQSRIVSDLGATELQGSLFSKPMHADRVPGFISRFEKQARKLSDRLELAI